MAGLAARLQMQKDDDSAWELLAKALKGYVWDAMRGWMRELPRKEWPEFFKEVWSEIRFAISTRYKFRSKVSTYAWSVAYKTCWKRFRRTTRVRFRQLPSGIVDPGGSTGLDAMMKHEQNQQLLALLAKLPEIDQKLLSLRYGVGDHGGPFRLAEIAKRLGFTNANSAGQALHRARKRLKKLARGIE